MRGTYVLVPVERSDTDSEINPWFRPEVTDKTMGLRHEKLVNQPLGPIGTALLLTSDETSGLSTRAGRNPVSRCGLLS